MSFTLAKPEVGKTFTSLQTQEERLEKDKLAKSLVEAVATKMRLLKKDLTTMQDAISTGIDLSAVEIGRCYGRHEDAMAILVKAKNWR